MKPFLHDDFLLETETARELYHGVAEGPADHRLPLPPARPSRWPPTTASARSPRSGSTATTTSGGPCARTACPSGFCTGDASDWEKFEAWAAHGARDAAQPALPLDAHGAARPFGVEDAARARPRRATIFDRGNDAAARGRLHDAGPARAVPAWRSSAPPTTPSTRSSRTRRSRSAPGPRHAGLPDLAAGQGRLRSRTSPAWNAWVGQARGGRRRRRSATWDAFLEALEKRHALLPRARLPRLRPRPRARSTPSPSRDAEVAALFARLRAGQALDAGEAPRLPLGAAPPPGAPRPRARLGAAVPPRRPAQQQHAHAPRCSAPTPASTRSATSSRRGRWRASSTASTRPTSWRRPSSTT